jgi:hypothetical protein
MRLGLSLTLEGAVSPPPSCSAKPFLLRHATSLLGVALSSSDIGRTLSAIVVGNSEGRKRKRILSFVYVRGTAGSLA